MSQPKLLSNRQWMACIGDGWAVRGVTEEDARCRYREAEKNISR